MSDFFARMGERALGVANALVPAVAPLYGDDVATRAQPGFVEEIGERRTDPRNEARKVAPVPDNARVTLAPPRRALDTQAPSREPRALEAPSAPASLAVAARIVPAEPPRVSPPSVPLEAAMSARSPAVDLDASADESPSREMKHRSPVPEDAEQRAAIEPVRHAEMREDARHELPRPRAEPPVQSTGLEAMLARLEALGARAHESAAMPASTVVRISIGRIEVRAAPTAPVVATQYRERKEPQGPSLAAFLAKKTAASS